MLQGTFSIAQRDFKSFFGTPLGWIAACILFLVSGIVFFIVTEMLLGRGQSMDPAGDIFGQILGFMNYINIFVIPAFTMKVMSEELHTGSFRLLSSAPISSLSIVFGKFLGVMFYFAVIGALLAIYPLFTFIFTSPDPKVVLSGWVGLMLNTASIVSIGLFVSALTKNQVLSYLGASFFIILFIFSSFIPGAPEWYRHSVNILDLGNDMTRGVIKTATVANFAAVTCLFLFLTRFVISSKKWSL